MTFPDKLLPSSGYISMKQGIKIISISLGRDLSLGLGPLFYEGFSAVAISFPKSM